MENIMNYGRKLKITRYMLQRAYLEGMLLHYIENNSNDGDFFERYFGHIYPENRLWLEENGIKIHTERITDSSHELFGCEVNCFYISDEITLTEEEKEESRDYCENVMSKFMEENIKNIMNSTGLYDDEDDDEFDPGDPYYNDYYGEDDDDDEDVDFSTEDFPDFLK